MILVLASSFPLAAQEVHGEKNQAQSNQTCDFNEKAVQLNAPSSKVVALINGLDLRIHYVRGSDSLARVTLSKHGKPLYTASIRNALMPYDSVIVSPDKKSFAITWSDAGSAGNWNVRVFHLSDHRLIDESDGLRKVEKAFSSKNRCDPWNVPIGPANNYMAIAWLKDDLLWLTASIYPDSQCHNMNYSEGYLLRVPTNEIVLHLSEPELQEAYRTCGKSIDLTH